MKPTKEKVLLVIVLGLVAGVAATDRTYVPVRLPSTSAPTDVPGVPGAAAAYARVGRPDRRSMFEQYSALRMPEPVELPELPAIAIPVATLPVRPYPHLDAARGLRHLLFDPPPPPEDLAAPPPPTDAPPPAVEEKPDKPEPPKPPDLSQWDWVKPILTGVGGGSAQPFYGRIDILAKDLEAGRDKYDLLVIPDMQFTFNLINNSDGKFMGGPVPFRERADDLGFADTIENNYSSKRRRMEGPPPRRELEPGQRRELAAWCMAEAEKPKYGRRKAWEFAAAEWRGIVKANPNDKDAMKELGRVYRLLQDLDAETSLYQWWLEAQSISKDPEVTALLGETMDLLGLAERARRCYEDALGTSTDPRVKLRLADLLLATGSLEDANRAAELYRRAAAEGERIPGVVGEARALIAVGKFEPAKAVLSKIGSEQEKDAGWYNAMGAIHYCAGALEPAKSHFQAAVDRAPIASLTLAISRTNLAAAKARLGATMAEDDAGRKGALEDALKTADAALKDDPLNYYWPLVVQGYAWRALAKPEKSVEALQDAVAAVPAEAFGRTLLGEFLLRDGRIAEARTQFVEAARISPGFPDALGGVGRAGGGDAGETRDYLRRASGLEPQEALWPLLGARVGLNDEKVPLKQRLEDAHRDLSYLLAKVDPNSFVANAALGWVRYFQGDAEDALTKWDAAMRRVKGLKTTSARDQAKLEEFKAWLDEASRDVNKWKNTRIWEDRFQRSDAEPIGNGWTEDEKNVKWSLKGNAACLGEGKERFQSGDLPSLHREWDTPKVLKVTGTFVIAREEPCDFDFYVHIMQNKQVDTMALGIRKMTGGEPRLILQPDPKTKATAPEYLREIPTMKEWPEDGRVTFSVERMDEVKGIVRLSLNGKVIPGFEALECQPLARGRGGKIRVEFRAKADPASRVQAKVESVELWLDQQAQ